ncbi:MAG: metal ABC transporter ATP-binding protein [Zavarzinella sp.]
MESLLEVKNLCVTLTGRPILKNLTLAIPKGQISALIGLNGSGKSTFLKTLLGEHHFSGDVLHLCTSGRKRGLPERVGYVPQKLSIDARLPLTVLEFIALSCQRRPLILGISRATKELAKTILKKVYAEHLLQSQLAKLSGGEMQRVLLAIALHPTPEILLLDEPAAGIDFADQEPFYQLISQLNKDLGVTVVLVSHDLHIVKKYANVVYCLRSGNIVLQGNPEEVLTNENLVKTFGRAASFLFSSAGGEETTHVHDVTCIH